MEYSTVGWKNEFRTDVCIKSQEHTRNATHGNDIFINTVKSYFNPQKDINDRTESDYQETTIILGMPGRHDYNNTNIVKNLTETLHNKHPKKGKNKFESGRLSYLIADDGRPGSQLIIQEKSPTTIDIQIVGRASYTNSYEVPRQIDKVSLVVSDNPLENAIAINQADIAKILHLVKGIQKDMIVEKYKHLRYKLIARSILGLSKLYADDVFLQKQEKDLYDIHHPKNPSASFTIEDMVDVAISHYTGPIADQYNTYLAIIPSQYILLPDAIKKDFDFFIQAVQDMQAKTQKVHDMRMSASRSDSHDEMITLLDNIHLNLVQRNSRFHNILQDMCKHPDVQKRLQVFDY